MEHAGASNMMLSGLYVLYTGFITYMGIHIHHGIKTTVKGKKLWCPCLNCLGIYSYVLCIYIHTARVIMEREVILYLGYLSHRKKIYIYIFFP